MKNGDAAVERAEDGTKHSLKWFLRSICQKQSLKNYSLNTKAVVDVDNDATPNQKPLSFNNALLHGVGNMLGGGIFGLPVVAMTLSTGPAIFVAAFFSGVSSYLTSLCSCELGVHLPAASTNPAYTSAYVLNCELVAFLTAWCLVLQSLFSTVISSVGIANSLDAMCSGQIRQSILSSMGHATDTKPIYGYLSDYPNVVAMAVCILLFILAVINIRVYPQVFTAVAIWFLFILGISVIYMFISASLEKHYAGDNDDFGFTPFGYFAIFNGAAVLTNNFNLFPTMYSLAESTKRPVQTIPTVLSNGMAVAVAFTVVISLALKLYTPWFELNPNWGLPGIFVARNVPWLKILTGIAAIIGYLICGSSGISSLCRITKELVQDGFFPKFLNHTSSMIKVPLLTLVIGGISASICAIVLDFVGLAHILALSSLAVYTLIGINLLLVRYDRAEIYINVYNVDEIEPNVGQPCHSERCKTPSFLQSQPPGRVPKILVLVFVIITIVLALLLKYSSSISSSSSGRQLWLTFFCVLLGLGLVICTIILYCFTHQKETEYFSLRCIPMVPLFVIICNIFMAVSLDLIAWLRLAIWVIMGLLVYLAYGVWHSKLSKDGESRDNIHLIAPLDDVIPQTETVFNHSKEPVEEHHIDSE